jgi:uroporphyrinogen decarboxylase
MTPTKLGTVLGGTRVFPPPVWLMRQAGRYLPEYRAVREQCADFLDLCARPDLAAEVTMQPISRFDLDAAIVFADILLVPHALGLEVCFVDGEGPRVEVVSSGAAVARLNREGAARRLAPVGETIARVRQELSGDKSLIGFCGGPWTVATYMAEGAASSDQLAARLWAYRDPSGFGALIGLLSEVSADYLIAQVRAGADVLKIFDSWAGVLPDAEFDRWVVDPTRRVVEQVRTACPGIRIIGFARGAGARAGRYLAATGIDALALDQAAHVAAIRDHLGNGHALQGNIDPLALLAGGRALDEAVDGCLAAFAGLPHICNLGHGVHKDTPPEHVGRLVRRVRAAVEPGAEIG